MVHVNLRRRRYRMMSHRLDKNTGGYCNPPMEPGRDIGICSTIKDPEIILEILIHEMLHACHWDLDESVIEESAACIAKALVKLGVTVNPDDIHKRLKRQHTVGGVAPNTR